MVPLSHTSTTVAFQPEWENDDAKLSLVRHDLPCKWLVKRRERPVSNLLRSCVCAAEENTSGRPLPENRWVIGNAQDEESKAREGQQRRKGTRSELQERSSLCSGTGDSKQ